MNQSFPAEFQAKLDETMAQLTADNILPRIWQKDHTVWKPDPTEISNRLGWLTTIEEMLPLAADLEEMAQAVRDAGFQDVVLLGMGGSSLAPEVLRTSYGRQPNFPQLHVLDSTVPAWVNRTAAQIDPARTLFIVSSKSGGTIETMSLYHYFYALVTESRGHEAGRNFMAITDPGSSLQKLAETTDFRHIYLNDPNIGGRYSALSFFGLAPAALAGFNVTELLRRSHQMAANCGPTIPLTENPGGWLGALLGAAAADGRDKLTFITSPTMASFGLWAEQLIAESVGKEGKGILPIAQEPLGETAVYGPDRIFAYLRLEGDDNDALDTHATDLQDAGQPVIRLHLRDRHDLGAEFFRWELATAVAGVILAIQPFDQPNVQSAKDSANKLLKQIVETGEIPDLSSTGNLPDLLAAAQPGDYLAIMAYLDGDAAVEGALQGLRQGLLARHQLPTTMGYGPRFLHSTGQYHKGGPNNGLFLQLTADYEPDLHIPGSDYRFVGLVSAQAAGDYQALVDNGRRVVRVHLGRQPAAKISQL
jgi:transaldolase / glucose-6-phosphate isomerase